MSKGVPRSIGRRPSFWSHNGHKKSASRSRGVGLGAPLEGADRTDLFVVRFLGGGSAGGAQARGRRRGHPPCVDNALAVDDAGEDPDRWLVIGPDQAGNLLEVVVLAAGDDRVLVIHAMRMRAKYRRLLK